MSLILRALLALVCLLPFCKSLEAQTAPDVTDVRPFSPHDGTATESVSLTNGSLVMDMPLWSFHQRGKLKLDFRVIYDSPNFDFNYNCNYLGSPEVRTGGQASTASNTDVTKGPVTGADSSVDLLTAAPAARPIENPCVYPFCRRITDTACYSFWSLSQAWAEGSPSDPNVGLVGIKISASTDYGIVPQISALTSSNDNPYQQNVFYGYYFKLITPDGGSHNLAHTVHGDYRTVDGTGFQYVEATCTLRDADGTVYQFDCGAGANDGVNPKTVAGRLNFVEDTDGNKITLPVSGGWVDSEGRAIPAVPRNAGISGAYAGGGSKFSLDAGEDRRISIVMPPQIRDYLRVMGGQALDQGWGDTDKLFFFGAMQYADALGIKRNTVVCRHYENKLKRFVAIDDADREYAD